MRSKSRGQRTHHHVCMCRVSIVAVSPTRYRFHGVFWIDYKAMRSKSRGQRTHHRMSCVYRACLANEASLSRRVLGRLKAQETRIRADSNGTRSHTSTSCVTTPEYLYLLQNFGGYLRSPSKTRSFCSKSKRGGMPNEHPLVAARSAFARPGTRQYDTETNERQKTQRVNYDSNFISCF